MAEVRHLGSDIVANRYAALNAETEDHENHPEAFSETVMDEESERAVDFVVAKACSSHTKRSANNAENNAAIEGDVLVEWLQIGFMLAVCALIRCS